MRLSAALALLCVLCATGAWAQFRKTVALGVPEGGSLSLDGRFYAFVAEPGHTLARSGGPCRLVVRGVEGSDEQCVVETLADGVEIGAVVTDRQARRVAWTQLHEGQVQVWQADLPWSTRAEVPFPSGRLEPGKDLAISGSGNRILYGEMVRDLAEARTYDLRLDLPNSYRVEAVWRGMSSDGRFAAGWASGTFEGRDVELVFRHSIDTGVTEVAKLFDRPTAGTFTGTDVSLSSDGSKLASSLAWAKDDGWYSQGFVVEPASGQEWAFYNTRGDDLFLSDDGTAVAHVWPLGPDPWLSSRLFVSRLDGLMLEVDVDDELRAATPADSPGTIVGISADGRCVLFSKEGQNLFGHKYLGSTQVFAHRLDTRRHLTVVLEDAVGNLALLVPRWREHELVPWGSLAWGDELAGSVRHPDATESLLLRTAGVPWDDVYSQGRWKPTWTDRTSLRRAGSPLPAGWRPIAAGDLDHDSRDELVLQRTSDGALASYRTALVYLPSVEDRWEVLALADVDGDTWLDLVVRDDQADPPILAAYLLEGTALREFRVLAERRQGWLAFDFLDVDGNGCADLVEYNGVERRVGAWLVEGGVPVRWTSLVLVPEGWSPRAVIRYRQN